MNRWVEGAGYDFGDLACAWSKRGGSGERPLTSRRQVKTELGFRANDCSRSVAQLDLKSKPYGVLGVIPEPHLPIGAPERLEGNS